QTGRASGAAVRNAERTSDPTPASRYRWPSRTSGGTRPTRSAPWAAAGPAPNTALARQSRSSEQTRKIIEVSYRHKSESNIVDVLSLLGKQGIEKSIVSCHTVGIRQRKNLAGRVQSG